jgi:2-C-methyl-D-erythritol 4-phosphate cytidylyltransferase
VDAAERHPAVIPAVEVSDTLKRFEERDAPAAGADPLAAILGTPTTKPANLRVVESTIDRSRLVAVQTPQLFRADLLKKAYDALAKAAAAPGFRIPTDDAEAVERLGETVTVIDGDARNIKITRPADVHLARQILGLRDTEGRAVHKRF